MRTEPVSEGFAVRQALIAKAKRIIIKIGTNVLVTGNSLDTNRIGAIAREVARIQHQGREVILITSGAIGAGMKLLKMARRPKSVHELQIAASVGQTIVINEYARSFLKHDINVGQVLLTHEDLSNRERHLNMRHCVLGLLRRGCIPVVNENDVVSVDAIRVGDNDSLAALLGLMVEADLVVLLSSTDGLRKPVAANRMERVSLIRDINTEIHSWVRGKENDLSVGGMGAKLKATKTLLDGGVSVVIADGRDPKNLSHVFACEDVGTLFCPAESSATLVLAARKRWIAHFQRSNGNLIVDAGASSMLREKGKSLLAVGLASIEGHFAVGALVNIKDNKGELIAKGLVEYSSEELAQIKGKKTADIAAVLGEGRCEEVVHRDNMVLV